MTTKAAQKYRCGSFSSNWVKPLCCPWRFSLLRDHAGDRQLVKQPRRHYPDPFPRKSGTSGDLHLETIKSFNEVA